MRALSLTQPWAWIVVHGGKRIENRTWTTALRGMFLIAASQQMSRAQYAAAWEYVRHYFGTAAAHAIPKAEYLTRGCIVGRAELVDVLQPTEHPSQPWHMRGQYGFVLRDVQPTHNVACKGLQRFWSVPQPQVDAALHGLEHLLGA